MAHVWLLWTRGPGRTGNEEGFFVCSLTCQRCSSTTRHRVDELSHWIKGPPSLSLCHGMDTAKVPQHPRGHKRIPRTPIAQARPLTFSCTWTPERISSCFSAQGGLSVPRVPHPLPNTSPWLPLQQALPAGRGGHPCASPCRSLWL